MMTSNFSSFGGGDVPPPDLPAAPSGNPADIRPTYRGREAVAAGLEDTGRRLRGRLVVLLEEEAELVGGVSGLLSWVDFLSLGGLLAIAAGLASILDGGTFRYWGWRTAGLFLPGLVAWLVVRLGGGRWRKFFLLLAIIGGGTVLLFLFSARWTAGNLVAALLGIIIIFVFLILRETAQ